MEEDSLIKDGVINEESPLKKESVKTDNVVTPAGTTSGIFGGRFISQGKTDRLVDMYPKFSKEIQRARAKGISDNEVESALVSFEKVAIDKFGRKNVFDFLNRDNESMRRVTNITNETKIESYKKLYEGKLTEKDIRQRVTEANLLGMNENIFLNNDELYNSLAKERAEAVRTEAYRKQSASPVWDAVGRTVGGLAHAIPAMGAYMAEGVAFALTNVKSTPGLKNLFAFRNSMSSAFSSMGHELIAEGVASGDMNKVARGRMAILTAQRESADHAVKTADRLLVGTIAPILRKAGEDVAKEVLKGREPDMPFKIGAGVGSMATFMIPGFYASRLMHLGGRAGLALSFGLGYGGTVSLGEGGDVYYSLRRKGIPEEEALAAGNITAAVQLPLNVYAGAIGKYFAVGGGIISTALARGTGNSIQDMTQRIISEYMKETKNGKPHTVLDLIFDIPELAKKYPDAMLDVGIPSFITGAIIGGGESFFSRTRKPNIEYGHAAEYFVRSLEYESYKQGYSKEAFNNMYEKTFAPDPDFHAAKDVAFENLIKMGSDQEVIDVSFSKGDTVSQNDNVGPIIDTVSDSTAQYSGPVGIQSMATELVNNYDRVYTVGNHIVAVKDVVGSPGQVIVGTMLRDPDTNALTVTSVAITDSSNLNDSNIIIDKRASAIYLNDDVNLPQPPVEIPPLGSNRATPGEEPAPDRVKNIVEDFKNKRLTEEAKTPDEVDAEFDLNLEKESTSDYYYQLGLNAKDEVGSRVHAISSIRLNGGINYADVKATIGDDKAKALIKRLGPGIFRKDGKSLADHVLHLSEAGAEKINSPESIYELLLGENISGEGVDIEAYNNGLKDSVNNTRRGKRNMRAEIAKEVTADEEINAELNNLPTEEEVVLPTQENELVPPAPVEQPSETIDGKTTANRKKSKQKEQDASGLTKEKKKEAYSRGKKDVQTPGTRANALVLIAESNGLNIGRVKKEIGLDNYQILRSKIRGSDMWDDYGDKGLQHFVDVINGQGEIKIKNPIDLFELLIGGNKLGEGREYDTEYMRGVKAQKDLRERARSRAEMEAIKRRVEKAKREKEASRSAREGMSEEDQPLGKEGRERVSEERTDGGRSEYTGVPVFLSDIRKLLEQIVPIRFGRTGKNRVGLFKGKEEVVRSKFINDLPTITHEVGHYLDKRLGLSKKANDAAIEELTVSGKRTSGEDYTVDQIIQEGVANFFMDYSINKENARDNYPEYFKMFESALGEDKMLKPTIDAIVARIEAYFKQHPRDIILSSLIRGSDKTSKPILKVFSDSIDQAHDAWVDELGPIKRATDIYLKKSGLDYLPDELNAYARARTAAASRSRAGVYITKISDVLKGIKKNKDNRNQISSYMAAMAAQDYRALKQHPGLGTTKEQELQIIAETPVEIKDAVASILKIYNEAVYNTLVDGGILTKKQFDLLRKTRPNYVPYYRVDPNQSFDDGVASLFMTSGNRFVNLENPIKRAKGVSGEEEIIPIKDPLESIISNIAYFQSIHDRNLVGKALVEMSKKEGGGFFAEEVTPQKPKKEVIIDPKTGKPKRKTKEERAKEKAEAKKAEAKAKGELKGKMGEPVFHVWDNGERRYFVTDPSIYKAMLMINSRSGINAANKLANILYVPAKLAASTLRAGAVVYSPAFIYTNMTRDSRSVSIVAKKLRLPFTHTIKGVMAQIKASMGDEKAIAMIDAAVEEGVFSSGITEIMDHSPLGITKMVRDGLREGNITDEIRRGVSSLLGYVGSINEAIEIAPKLTEFHDQIAAGVPRQEAAVRAREINLDYSRHGYIGKKFNVTNAFFNARIQGASQFFRAFKRDPVTTLSRVVLFGILTSIVSWSFGHFLGSEDDQKEYAEMSRSIKDKYDLYKVGDSWVKLPKPDAFGLYGALTERVLDRMILEDRGFMRDFGNTVIDAFNPGILPTLSLPLLELWANKNTFTGGPIIPRQLQGLPPEQQYTPFSSGVAMRLGQNGYISPIAIDHIVSGYGGTIGKFLMSSLDPWLKTNKAEEMKVTESVLLRSIFQNPMKGSESVQRFYDVMDRTTVAYARYKERVKADSNAVITKDAAMARMFDKTQSNIAKMRKAQLDIRSNADMSPHDKRTRIDLLDASIISIASEALKVYDNYERR